MMADPFSTEAGRSQPDLANLAQDLEQSLHEFWDARVVPYDHARFPFADRIREEIVKLGYPIRDLATLHEVVPEGEVYALTKKLCDVTNTPEFREFVDDFVWQAIVPEGQLKAPLAVQRFLNVRIMIPSKPHGVFPFHTGLLYGHGQASRSLWLPLTDLSQSTDHSASMQIIPLQRSRELIQLAMRSRLSVDAMTELFGTESKPIIAAPGQVCLFNQENIHGNFVNTSGKTRVSIDFRLAEARHGDQLARKIPGGYFEVLAKPGMDITRPSEAQLRNGAANIIYLNNNTPNTQEVPPHLQRSMVYDYCKSKQLRYDFELFELEGMNHLPTLFHIIRQLSCNPILYSIYSLPEEPQLRQELYQLAQAEGRVLYFINEDLAIDSPQSGEYVEQTLAFAKYGKSSST